MPRLAPTTNRSLTGGLRVSMAIWPSHLPYRGQGSSSFDPFRKHRVQTYLDRAPGIEPSTAHFRPRVF